MTSSTGLPVLFAAAVVACAFMAFRELRRAELACEPRIRPGLVLAFLALLTYAVFFHEGVRTMPDVNPYLIAFHLIGLPISFGGVFLLYQAEKRGRSFTPALVLILLGVGMLFVGNYSR